MTAPTAGWSLPSLLSYLGRHGWGDDLDGRRGQGLRSCLRALADLLPPGAAEGKVTAAQVSDAAGLSVRWTRRCLHTLENLGIITWTRGWLDKGKPRAGWLRVEKASLAAIASGLFDALAPRVARRREDLRARLASLSQHTQRSCGPRPRRSPHPRPHSGHNPLSERAELSATPPPYRESSGASACAEVLPPAPDDVVSHERATWWRDQIRAAMRGAG